MSKSSRHVEMLQNMAMQCEIQGAGRGSRKRPERPGRTPGTNASGLSGRAQTTAMPRAVARSDQAHMGVVMMDI